MKSLAGILVAHFAAEVALAVNGSAPDGGLCCGFPFEMKKNYIVYARFDSVRRVFGTSDCDRTRSGPKAHSEWDVLGPPKWASSGL
ncbi:MAG: hypothetical protein ABIU54_04550 [Candidatus Eisenbacteria bacterium]